MSSQPNARFTPEEYLALERQAEVRSEYYRGEVVTLNRASREHNLIVFNIAASFHQQLEGREVSVLASDMRVKISQADVYTYPDGIVVCGRPQFDDEQKDTLLNPTVIVEVLSESTEAYDRGQKFAHYRTLTSLSDYLMVAQDRYHIEHFARRPDGQWLLSETKGRESSIHVASIDCDLSLDAVYHKVEIS